VRRAIDDTAELRRLVERGGKLSKAEVYRVLALAPSLLAEVERLRGACESLWQHIYWPGGAVDQVDHWCVKSHAVERFRVDAIATPEKTSPTRPTTQEVDDASAQGLQQGSSRCGGTEADSKGDDNQAGDRAEGDDRPAPPDTLREAVDTLLGSAHWRRADPAGTVDVPVEAMWRLHNAAALAKPEPERTIDGCTVMVCRHCGCEHICADCDGRPQPAPASEVCGECCGSGNASYMGVKGPRCPACNGTGKASGKR
jgi:hypothetical protein